MLRKIATTRTGLWRNRFWSGELRTLSSRHRSWRSRFPPSGAVRIATSHGDAFHLFKIVSARFFASTTTWKDISVVYATQTGTAQLFAQQLSDALSEQGLEHSVLPMNQVQLRADNDPNNNNKLTLFVTSTAGVGEPPENGRAFLEQLQVSDAEIGIRNYAVFGLGHSKAHPNHFNAFAKLLDGKLGDLGGQRVLPLCLGDDSDCIEDDFDQWQTQVIEFLRREEGEKEPTGEKDTPKVPIAPTNVQTTTPTRTAKTPAVQPTQLAPCPGSRSDERRLISSHYPMLKLQASDSQMVRSDLLQTHAEVYPAESTLWTVRANTPFNRNATANGLHEIQLQCDAKPSYTAGDHLLIMPRNPDYAVQALLERIDVDPHATISATSSSVSPGKPYPHPTHLSVYETLSHCVELSALPSPATVRYWRQNDDFNYREDIATPQVSILELLLSSTTSRLALEDILYSLPPMRPRYYSIASSPKVDPDSVKLTYRPVQYLTSRGTLKEGLCTYYLSRCREASQVVAALRSNPSFRLPVDPLTPVALVAGGCGVAPIRAFLEERIWIRSQGVVLGDCWLFLGFRDPADQVYGDLVQQALDVQAVTRQYVTFTSGCSHNQCGLVSDAIRRQDKALYELIQADGHIYICGGARTFGAAIANELHSLLEREGSMSESRATEFLQNLTHKGRIHEDLSD